MDYFTIITEKPGCAPALESMGDAREDCA